MADPHGRQAPPQPETRPTYPCGKEDRAMPRKASASSRPQAAVTLEEAFDYVAQRLTSRGEARRQRAVACLEQTGSAAFTQGVVGRLINTLDICNKASRPRAIAALTGIGWPAAVVLMDSLFETRDLRWCEFLAGALAAVGQALGNPGADRRGSVSRLFPGVRCLDGRPQRTDRRRPELARRRLVLRAPARAFHGHVRPEILPSCSGRPCRGLATTIARGGHEARAPGPARRNHGSDTRACARAGGPGGSRLDGTRNARRDQP